MSIFAPSANAKNIKSPEVQQKVDTIILDKLNNENHGLKGLTNFLSKVSNKAEYTFKTAARGLKVVVSNIYAKFRSMFSNAYFKIKVHHLDTKIQKAIDEESLNVRKTDKRDRVMHSSIEDALKTLKEEISNGKELTTKKTNTTISIDATNNEIGRIKIELLESHKQLVNQRNGILPQANSGVSADGQITDSNSFNQTIGNLKNTLTINGTNRKGTVFSLRNLQTKEQLLSNRQNNSAKRIEKAVIELANRLESTAYNEARAIDSNLPTAQQKLEEELASLKNENEVLLNKQAAASDNSQTTVLSRAIAYLEGKLSPKNQNLVNINQNAKLDAITGANTPEATPTVVKQAATT